MYPGVMSDYRDKAGALRRQQAALQDELDVREHELAEAEAVVAEQDAELAKKDAELARLREELREAAPPPQTGSQKVLAPDGNAICPTCQKHNAPHYKFCLNCGTDLELAPDVALQASPQPAMDSKTAPSPVKSPSGTAAAMSVIFFALMAMVAILGVVLWFLAA